MVTVAWLVATAVSALAPRFGGWSVVGAWLATAGATPAVALLPAASVNVLGIPMPEYPGLYSFALVGGFIALASALTRSTARPLWSAGASVRRLPRFSSRQR